MDRARGEATQNLDKASGTSPKIWIGSREGHQKCWWHSHGTQASKVTRSRFCPAHGQTNTSKNTTSKKGFGGVVPSHCGCKCGLGLLVLFVPLCRSSRHGSPKETDED